MNEKILLMRLKHKSEKALSEVIEKYTALLLRLLEKFWIIRQPQKIERRLVADTRYLRVNSRAC